MNKKHCRDNRNDILLCGLRVFNRQLEYTAEETIRIANQLSQLGIHYDINHRRMDTTGVKGDLYIDYDEDGDIILIVDLGK